MNVKKSQLGKSAIKTTDPIEDISAIESFVHIIDEIKKGHIQSGIIGLLPEILSDSDQTSRDIILKNDITQKIIRDHGALPSENFAITANMPTCIISWKENEREKLNFIKEFGDRGFVLGAERRNGHYVVTFFEVKDKAYLKSLSRRGRLVFSGGAAVPSSATSSKEDARQPGLSGVGTDEMSI